MMLCDVFVLWSIEIDRLLRTKVTKQQAAYASAHLVSSTVCDMYEGLGIDRDQIYYAIINSPAYHDYDSGAIAQQLWIKTVLSMADHDKIAELIAAV